MSEPITVPRNHWEAGATFAVLEDDRLTDDEQEILANWFDYLYDVWQDKQLVLPPNHSMRCIALNHGGTQCEKDATLYRMCGLHQAMNQKSIERNKVTIATTKEPNGLRVTTRGRIRSEEGMTFYDWLQHHKNDGTPTADTANEIQSDIRHGCLHEKSQAKMRAHMVEKHHADDIALEAFDEAWNEYRHRNEGTPA